MGNTQTQRHSHSSHSHSKHSNSKHSNSKHSISAYSPKKDHQRTRRHRYRHTRKQHGGFWPFSKKENADITVAPSSAADKCASCPAECRTSLPDMAGIKAGVNNKLENGNNALLGFNADVGKKVGETGAGLADRVGNLFGNKPAQPPAEPQAGGRRRRKGRKTNRRRKHKKH